VLLKKEAVIILLHSSRNKQYLLKIYLYLDLTCLHSLPFQLSAMFEYYYRWKYLILLKAKYSLKSL